MNVSPLPPSDASRPAPGEGGGELLANRVFVHTRPGDAAGVLGLIDHDTSGLVLTSSDHRKLVRTIRKCRDELGFLGPILFDPGTSETVMATREAPFKQELDQLFQIPLADQLQNQIQCGADAALTPTGYIQAGDLSTIDATLRSVAELRRDDVIVSLPLDQGWLAEGVVDKAIELLADSGLPKAIMLGGQLNPPQRVLGGVRNLRRLITEVPNTALFRTDLAGLDAVAQGALAASIGTSSGLRHIIPPGKSANHNKKGANEDQSPSLLVADLMSFLRGSTLADRFGELPSPLCHCTQCDGRQINQFLGQASWKDARLHSVAVWSAWSRNVLHPDSLAGRRRYWKQLCREAIAAHTRYDALVGAGNELFVPPEPLQIWASEDLPHTRITTTNHPLR